ncbi:MAG: hypothetical protein QNK85_01375 [Crocinitomicaceae bacterium]|jgi:hypothetical protein
MSAPNNIWSKISRVLFIVKYTTVDDLKSFRDAIKSAGLNIHDCTVLAIVKTKKEKNVLTEQYNVVFISEQEFNLFGILKNDQAKNIASRSYDMILYSSDVSRKIFRLLNKTKKKISVGINCKGSEQRVNIKTEGDTPSHLINFTKQTLEKII